MRILIYSPANARAVDQQSQAILFKKMGHEVILLTWMPPGVLHENLKALGVPAYSTNVTGRRGVFFARQVRFLIRFCKENKIDIAFCHGQGCGMVSGIARRFVKTRMVYVRHNSTVFRPTNERKSRWINSIANKLSLDIIAISDAVKRELLKEGVEEKRIHRINLCYDEDQYKNDRQGKEAEIKERYRTKLMVLYIARLVEMKKHMLAFEAFQELAKKGMDCKLVCIGQGENLESLQHWISGNNMQDHIIMAGWVPNVFDYIIASDIVMLLSSSEASSHISKEAAYCDRTILVRKEAGDFGDIIVSGVNGFAVGDEPVKESVEILERIYKDKSVLVQMAKNLRETVDANFSLESSAERYSALFARFQASL